MNFTLRSLCLCLGLSFVNLKIPKEFLELRKLEDFKKPFRFFKTSTFEYERVSTLLFVYLSRPTKSTSCVHFLCPLPVSTSCVDVSALGTSDSRSLFFCERLARDPARSTSELPSHEVFRPRLKTESGPRAALV